MSAAQAPQQTTVDAAETARFGAIAAEVWDPVGKFRPLHKLNPARMRFLRDRLAEQFDRDPRSQRPLEGLTIVDVGCGGGIVSEPLARLGAAVTGIDAAPENIAVAATHAADAGLKIDYRCLTAEDLAASGERFDAVVAMEIVEHVADVGLFAKATAALVKPGGGYAIATLNRTVKSLLLAKIGAEYVLRWLPVGTHDWRRFLKPSEVATLLRANGLELRQAAGVTYSPLMDEWVLSRDLDVNYMLFAARPT
ncbi:MAG: bifunctional 2-polyprenyl-6-hydroxyphenol methylase/3-demethylubiquinol 3-O-methyltransferase UbiG [Alphaproteobacteria bacterium]